MWKDFFSFLYINFKEYNYKITPAIDRKWLEIYFNFIKNEIFIYSAYLLTNINISNPYLLKISFKKE